MIKEQYIKMAIHILLLNSKVYKPQMTFLSSKKITQKNSVSTKNSNKKIGQRHKTPNFFTQEVHLQQTWKWPRTWGTPTGGCIQNFRTLRFIVSEKSVTKVTKILPLPLWEKKWLSRKTVSRCTRNLKMAYDLWDPYWKLHTKFQNPTIHNVWEKGCTKILPMTLWEKKWLHSKP